MQNHSLSFSVAPGMSCDGYMYIRSLNTVIEGTDRALAATEDAELECVPAFTGSPEQLWRIEQLTDGTYRIMPKSVPGHDETEQLAGRKLVAYYGILRCGSRQQHCGRRKQHYTSCKHGWLSVSETPFGIITIHVEPAPTMV